MSRLVRLRSLSAPSILFLISICFCWKLVLTNQYTWLEGPDLAYQVLPWYQFQAGEWHQGHFPLWDPNQWAGQPLLGQAQPGAAYPLNWLLFSLPLRHGWIRQAYLHWYFLVIHFLGSLFAYLLCRDLGRRRSASILAGCIFAYGGFVGTNDWPQMLNGAIWAPLVFLFLLRAVRGDRPIYSGCLSGMFLGISWLSGHHQIPIFLSLAAGAAWIYYCLRNRKLVLPAVCFGVFLILTSALQTLPAYEYGRLSQRWVGLENPIPWNVKVPYSIHSEFATTPETLLGIFFPGMNQHTDPFMGLLAMAFAFLAVVSVFEDARVKLFGALGVGGLLFALGDRTMLHGILYAVVPMVEKARSPSMALFIFNFSICILSAYGLDSLRDKKHAEWGLRIARGLGVIWVVLFGVVVICAMVGRPLSQNRPLVSGVFAVLASGLMYGYLRGRLAGRTLGLLAGILVAGELSLNFGVLLPNRYSQNPTFYLKNIPELSPVVEFLRTQALPLRVDVDDSFVHENGGDMYGFEQSGGYLASLTSNVLGVEVYTERGQRLLGVQYFVGKRPKFPSQVEIFQSPGGLKVYRNPGAFPRAWVVHRVQTVANGEPQREFWRNASNDLSKTASVRKATPPLEVCDDNGGTRMTSHESNFVQVSVSAECRGLVILGDTYYPGWSATVDGSSTPIYETYGMLRGVVVERGSHTVEYTYKPLSVEIGGASTLLGLLGGIFCLTRRVKHG